MRRWLTALLLAASCWLVISGDDFRASSVQAAERGGEESAEAEGGVPGFDKFQTDLALWSLIVFLIFVAVLGKFAWGPLVAGLNQRESRVRQDIADAESARVKAEKMLAEHQLKLDKVQDEVKEILAEARRDADQARQNIMQTAQAEADATKKRAVVEIERARDQALKELFDAMAGQVATATEYVLGHGLNSADQDQLIQQALAQVGNGSKA